MAEFGSAKLDGLKECMELFNPKRIRQVVSRSLYRTGKQIRTRASSKIREGYNLKKKDLDDKIRVQRGDMMVQIIAGGKNLNASEFGPVTWSPKMAGAIVHIKRGSGQMISHSFQVMRWGGKVFVRQGKARVPLKPIVGPSVKQLFGDKVIAVVISKTLEEVAQKNFESALSFATGASMDLGE
jgi:hypothetical protein